MTNKITNAQLDIVMNYLKQIRPPHKSAIEDMLESLIEEVKASRNEIEFYASKDNYGYSHFDTEKGYNMNHEFATLPGEDLEKLGETLDYGAMIPLFYGGKRARAHKAKWFPDAYPQEDV